MARLVGQRERMGQLDKARHEVRGAAERTHVLVDLAHGERVGVDGIGLPIGGRDAVQ